VVTILYSLFLHPLRRYPGPKFAAATRLPITYTLIRGRGPQWIRSLHEKYGQVVRVAPDELSFIDKQAWRDIYSSSPAAKYGMKRSDDFFAYFFDQQSTAASIVSANEEDHRRLRRIFSQAFSKTALAAQEPLIITHVDLLVRKLKESSSETANMVDMYCFTIFDIMADLMFGESLHLLDNTEYTPWVKSVPGYIRASIVLASLAKFPVLRFLMAISIPRIAAKHYKRFLKSTSEKVNLRLSSTLGRPDIIHFLSNPDEKMSLSRAEIDNAALVLMLAGSDTTPSILSGLTYLLLKHKETLGKLVQEIRSTFDSDSSINLKSISKLEYLGACIDEGFRAYPAAPIGFPRIVPSGGASISGGWVAEGTTVYVTPLAAYDSPLNFRSPKSFTPERWLPQSEAFYSGDQKAVVQPFSLGPRDCLGKS
jgi:cytochrome P450